MSKEGKMFMFTEAPMREDAESTCLLVAFMRTEPFTPDIQLSITEFGHTSGEALWFLTTTRPLNFRICSKFDYVICNEPMIEGDGRWRLGRTYTIKSEILLTVMVTGVNTENSGKVAGDVTVLLPVEHWSTHYVLITPVTPFMILTAVTDTNVRITFKLDKGERTDGVFTGHPKIKRIQTGTVVKQFLHGKQSLTIADYNPSNGYTFTGSVVDADQPIGILAGGTKAKISFHSTTDDFVLETQLPTSIGGKLFLVQQTPKVCADDPDIMQAMLLEPGATDVLRILNSSTGAHKVLTSLRFLHDHDMFNAPIIDDLPCKVQYDIEKKLMMRIETKKRILLVQYRNGVFLRAQNDEYDVAGMIVLPTHMYRNYYYIVAPSLSKTSSFQHNYVTLISTQPFDPFIEPAFQYNAFVSSHNEDIKMFVIVFYIISGRMIKVAGKNCTDLFGAYISGGSVNVGYMTFVDFTLAQVDGPCKKTKPVPGDHVDNDCDGGMDSLLPEPYPAADTQVKWTKDSCKPYDMQGQWSAWSNEDTCDVLDCALSRTRLCNSPIPGVIGEACSNNENEFSQTITTPIEACPILDCSRPCKPLTYSIACLPCPPRCTDCNRVTGQCYACIPGYSPIDNICKACPPGSHGFHCRLRWECLLWCQGQCDLGLGLCITSDDMQRQTTLVTYVLPAMCIISLIIITVFLCLVRWEIVPEPENPNE